jgi:hypothetical protein
MLQCWQWRGAACCSVLGAPLIRLWLAVQVERWGDSWLVGHQLPRQGEARACSGTASILECLDSSIPIPQYLSAADVDS